jgi:phosphonate transport system ATP-binding protein
VILAHGIVKRYGATVALAPLDLTIADGETVAVVGPSGSGKTTLLHVLAGLLAPDAGRVSVDGRDLSTLPPGRELARLVGVMHQQYDLVPHLAVVHNVLAGRLGEWSLIRSLVSLVFPRDAQSAHKALARVGIGDKLYERTGRLSGGEQQRVALARLLLQNPRAILADEPVSSVDPARAEDLVRLLVGIAAEGGHTLVASLHSVPLALQHFQRIIGLRGGRLVFDLPAAGVHPRQLDDLYALDGVR